MKLYYISNTRFPSERANSVQIVHMCQSFANHGHEVTLVTTDRKTSITEDPETYYNLKFNFKVHRLSVPDLAPYGRLPYLFQRLVFALKLLILLRKEPPDILYGREDWIFSLFLFFIPSEKIVFESHEARYSLGARTLLKKGARCVVISEGIRDYYLGKGVSASQLLVAHDAVDEQFFASVETKEEARKRLGIENKKPIAMYIGGLDTWKGAETFMEGSERTDVVQFVVIGGKDAETEEYKKQYPKVIFLGSRPYRELPHNQQAADILVVPNTAQNKLSAEYTSPLKVFAHMTAKVPILASDIPSLRAILTEETATFFNPDDPDSLAERVEEIVAHPDLMLKKAEVAYQRSKEFTWRKRVMNILNFIQ